MISGVSSGVTMSSRFSAQGQSPLEKIDQNGDQKLNQSEFEELTSKVSEMTGQEIDAEEAFSNADEDGNGSVTKSEMQQFAQENGLGPRQHMKRMRAGRAQGRPNPMVAFDENDDQSLSQSEFENLTTNVSERTGVNIDVEEAFANIDSNGDDEISQEELKEAKPKPPGGKPRGGRPPQSNMGGALSAFQSQSYSMMMNQEQEESIINILG